MSTTINTARVIEIGSVTAGIAVPDEGGFRFFSSGHPFDALDGRRFRSLKQATAAAHERWQQSSPPEPRSSRPRPNDVPADLLLQVPGPFLLPV
ncbi:hypothetical protein BB934_44825 (plasmid) [Microvirga ossetica]|jgi:hypothetical protein|uniref:Uncharacterized protein n=1 Tax=Microvirga ossetica TaxID=1882682 RepID=A0A1B2EZD2_9HYPH|nr:hypothetical protein [Microvirga ossetica]ANY85292.1 hypothetical protein BB934_44825 [Microvirga ossetica]